MDYTNSELNKSFSIIPGLLIDRRFIPKKVVLLSIEFLPH